VTKIEDKKYVVTFLPWLKLRDSVEVNNVLFWTFPNGKDEVPLRRGLTSQLKRMFRGYKDPEGRPVERLTVASLKEDPFRDLSGEETKRIGATIRLLAFSLLAENDYYRQGNYFNSSHFQHFHQRFQLGSKYVAPHTRRRDGLTWHGGYKHGELKFVMPLQTSTRQIVKPNAPLLQALVEFLEQETSDATAIRQAIDWFFPSNSDMDSMSWQIELMMMASAFEALFLIQDVGRKKDALMVKLPAIFSGRLTQEVGRAGTDGREATRSWKAWWMDEFYWLRNQVVHGGKIDTTRIVWKVDEHMTIAAMTLAICVKLILHEKGSYELSSSDEVMADAMDNFIAGGNLTERKLLDALRKATFDRAAEKAWDHIHKQPK
jgi:hypothetical protein